MGNFRIKAFRADQDVREMLYEAISTAVQKCIDDEGVLSGEWEYTVVANDRMGSVGSVVFRIDMNDFAADSVMVSLERDAEEVGTYIIEDDTSIEEVLEAAGVELAEGEAVYDEDGDVFKEGESVSVVGVNFVTLTIEKRESENQE